MRAFGAGPVGSGATRVPAPQRGHPAPRGGASRGCSEEDDVRSAACDAAVRAIAYQGSAVLSDVGGDRRETEQAGSAARASRTADAPALVLYRAFALPAGLDWTPREEREPGWRATGAGV